MITFNSIAIPTIPIPSVSPTVIVLNTNPLTRRVLDKWALNCRICLESADKMVNIFHKELGDEFCLADKINKCLVVTSLRTFFVTADDGYPNSICTDCIFLVENVLRFKWLCEQTAKRFSQESVVDQISPNKMASFEKLCENTPINGDHNRTATVTTTSAISDDVDLKVNQVKMEPLRDGGKTPKKRTRRKRTERVYIRNYQCEECGFLATCPAALEYHVALRHRDDRPFVCPDCYKTFKHQNMLNAHLVVHTLDPVVCETCGKTCKNKKLYANHKTIHTAEKKYQCSYCPYRSHVRKAVKRHETIHTGELNYACKSCEKKFRTSTLLNKHVREEHQNTIPYPVIKYKN